MNDLTADDLEALINIVSTHFKHDDLISKLKGLQLSLILFPEGTVTVVEFVPPTADKAPSIHEKRADVTRVWPGGLDAELFAGEEDGEALSKEINNRIKDNMGYEYDNDILGTSNREV